jgi:hypothetical protein
MFCKNCGGWVKSGDKFCKNCGQKSIFTKSSLLVAKIIEKIKSRTTIFFVLTLTVVVIGIFAYLNKWWQTNTSISYDQNKVASSVVNIFCPSTVSSEGVTGGSGTLLTEDGIVLTNSHIIPQDKKYIHVGQEGCLISLPDPKTGQPKSIYLAHPIVIPDLSSKYDLAFMQIYSAYYDETKKEYEGVYPIKFPSFYDTTGCENDNVQLGDAVRVFGYPTISGGYSLTLTDGIVSSFSGDGLIYTSAKVDHGDSGGLAVDSKGCMIGVPSMISSDQSESLGVVISMQLINNFVKELKPNLTK